MGDSEKSEILARLEIGDYPDDWFSDVLDFHKKFGCEIRSVPFQGSE